MSEAIASLMQQHIELSRKIADLESEKKLIAGVLREEMEGLGTEKIAVEGVGSVSLVHKKTPSLDKSKLKVEMTRYISPVEVENMFETCTSYSESCYAQVTPVKVRD
jgi:hypothetical protein